MGLILCSTPLMASDAEENHISVGERSLSHVERVLVQEQRSVLAQKIESGEELTEEENQVVIENSDQIEEKAQARSLTQKSFDATTYYTTHEGAFHRPIAVSFLGDTVELEDGSIWAVSSGDRYKTLDWMTGDTIIIIPNSSWFSSYDYSLVNINTGAKVKVNLSLGPIFNGVYTHWIVAIDYYYREICLEDGSVWKMSSWDSAIVNQWLPNDTVIIGINNGLFSGGNPNMLINVNMNESAIGNCIY